MSYNLPNTRERVAARRRLLRQKGQSNKPQARPMAGTALSDWLRNGKSLALALFVGSVSTLGYLLSSTQFTVQSIQVSGNDALLSEIVAEESGLNNLPIWFIDPKQIEAHLQENPYIEQANVTISLPNQAEIAIVERRPDVRWSLNGIQFLVDSSGKVLGMATEPASTDVLVINASGIVLQPNDHVDADAQQLARMLSVRLPNELGIAPALIGWDYGLGVFIKLDAGQTVVFGRSEHLDRKLLIFQQLLLEGAAFTYLDLRPLTPYYQNTAEPPSEETAAP